MNYCPKCGFPTENMKYCPKCGFELKNPEADASNDVGLGSAPAEIIEMAVEGSRFADAESSEEQSRREEIKSFRAALVGGNADHYLPIFEDLDRNGGQSWNWCGCLFAPMWFAYRKLYGWSAIAIFAPMLLGILFGFALVAASAGDGATNILSKCIGIACAIAFGVISNSAYKKRIDKLIAEMPVGEEERKRYIARKGGVSVGGLVLALVVNLGLSMLLTLVSM